MGSAHETLVASLVNRIDTALDAVSAVFSAFARTHVEELTKSGGDPVTEVDFAIDRLLRDRLREAGEGWLSEETADDTKRLSRRLVWVVDPLDGTREFIDGLPEFCTSIAAVVDGTAVAGGVLNPAAGIKVVGGAHVGLRCNGDPVVSSDDTTALVTVIASRSEVNRGLWDSVSAAGVTVRPMGSVAYKLARVAAGLDRATWTPVPKHEWDVAAGAALLLAAGGSAVDLDGNPLVFNQTHPWFSGVIAVPPGFARHLDRVRQFIPGQIKD